MKAWGRTLAAGILAIPTALLAQTGTGTGNGGQAYASLEAIESAAIQWYSGYNNLVSRYQGLRRDTAAVEVELEDPGFNTKLRATVPAALSDYGRITSTEMVSYLPQALIEDINTRIQREFYRGYSEWQAGMYPPRAYSDYDSDTRLWTRQYFEDWDRNYGYTWFGYQDPMDKLEFKAYGGSGGGANPTQLLQRASEVLDQVQGPVMEFNRFRPQIETERRGNFIKRTYQTLTNEAEFNQLKRSVEQSLQTAQSTLEQTGKEITASIRRAVAEMVQYQSGDLPYIGFGGRWYSGSMFGSTGGFSSGTGNGGFTYEPWNQRTGTGTGNGYDREFSQYRSGSHYNFGGTYIDTQDRMGLWTLLFDQHVLTGIPDKYRGVVQSRMIQAYYRGARFAKYNVDFRRPSGSGWGYNDYTYTWRSGTGNGRTSTWGSQSGTGNGYSGSYGSDRYRTGTGNGRTGASWNSGTGTGTGSTGTGTGTGTGSYNGNTGTGGQTPGFDDIFGGNNNGTGGGSYNGGTGTGTGSGSYNNGTGTGTGSGSYNSGTGTGTGSSGTGTGTGSGY